jgi:acetyltransferase-like isoleucine patch superfamily enzyme
MLEKMRVACILDSKKRTAYIVKHKIFASVGENFFFQPRILPADPELIRFHNNVSVSSGVTFINHDVFNSLLNNMNLGHFFEYKAGCIEVMDNVYIGADAIILPNVKIGPNVLVAAGSIVTKDVKENSVVAGVPAKVIGTFDDLIQKRKDEIISEPYNYQKLWEKFDKEKNNRD